jgi:hypothetical protein
MWLMIAINSIRLLYLVPIMSYRAKHPERYSEESNYKFARYIVKTMKLTGSSVRNAMVRKTFQKKADT